MSPPAGPREAPTAKPGCPEHLVPVINRHLLSIWRLHPDWLVEPQNKEVFPSLDAFEQRIQAWAFLQGFDVTHEGAGTKASPALRLWCIHHGSDTKNTRNLEDRVQRDKDGTIISDRKVDYTNVAQLGCLWKVRCSWKQLGMRNSKVFGFEVTYKGEGTVHSHALLPNPLEYVKHRKDTVEYRTQAAQATTHRIKTVPFSVSRRVLEDPEFGLMLTATEYYNFVRKSKLKTELGRQNVEGLLVTLQEKGFIYRCRVDNEVDLSGTVISRKLIQIWFTHPAQLEAARRFVTGFLLVIDGTFNTNDLRLTLVNMVGVLNTGETFPVAFSYCASESRDSFDFIWDSFKAHLGADWSPGVILGDWAKGLRASVPDAFPYCRLQGCDWHAGQAMGKYFNDKDYPTVEVDGFLSEEGLPIEGLKDQAWAYIQSMTEEDLELNRQFLINGLKDKHKDYINNHWRSEETSFVHCFTKFYRNCGSTSSQRGESYHPITRETLHANLSIEDSVNKLTDKIISVMKTIAMSEGRSMRNYPRHFQLSGQAFNDVRCRITLWAAQKIEQEWYSLGKLISQQLSLGDCHCQILARFALPCRHLLERAYLFGERIPLSLIHPRYWLQGPIYFAQDWQPKYPQEKEQEEGEIEVFGAQRQAQEQEQEQEQLTSLQKLSEVRQQLNPEMQHRLDQQTSLSLQRLLQAGTAKLAEQAVPLGLPDAVPKHKGRKKRVTGGSRIETGPEAAARNAKLRERAMKKALAREPDFKLKVSAGTETIVPTAQTLVSLVASPPRPALEDELETYPGTPPLQLSHKRSHSIMVDRTPTKSQAATPTSTPMFMDDLAPPLSTAPAATGRPGRAGRTNKVNSQQDWRATLIPKRRGGKN
jgi:MULE transposase domain